ncbi:OmpP1/FadL family transporter [Aquipseudomonas alcaligenes]|uniref:OmpP1/FadL family transporter n=1 Tax=Aquipseudomonas alcaligenes TaxID=43263 RepID=UPI003747AE3A
MQSSRLKVCVVSLMGLATSPAMAGSAGFAGIVASADNAETASSNPAGMSRLATPATSLSLMLANGFGKFEVDESQTTTSGGDPDDDSSLVFLPQAYYVHPLNDEVRFGISLTVPSGFGSEYGSDWAGRYYTDSYSLVYLAVTPAMSWRLNEQWSVGVALGINYIASESEVALNTLTPGAPDGRMKAELDGVGTNINLSLLWEMSEKTRFGLSYTSESKTDIDGDLKFRNPGPVIGGLLERGVLSDDIEVEQVQPQRIIGGLYHELDSGAFVVADLGWVEFSRFGANSISFDGEKIDVEDGNYNNFWAGAVGYGFPESNGRRFTLDAFYVQAPVDDDKRTLALALDRIWGVGAGVQFDRGEGEGIEFNVHLVDFGEGPVDTGPSALRGRVVGETDNPYALILSGAYHF